MERDTNSCVFVIRNVDTLLIKLVPVLDNHHLITIKQLDYLDLKNILIILSSVKSSEVKGKEK